MSSRCRIRRSNLRILSCFRRIFFQVNDRRLDNYTASNSPILSKPEFLIPSNKGNTGFGIDVRFFGVPIQFQPKPKKEKLHVRLNEDIEAHMVRLIVTEGEQTGNYVVTRNEALQRAKKMNMDLVEVQRTANPPVCKIMDYNKETYTKEKILKERAKSKVRLKTDTKLVKFSVKTEINDLKIKANTIIRMMEHGFRVKCLVMPKRKSTEGEREDLEGLLSRLIELMGDDITIVESGPLLDKTGAAYIVIRHVKFGKPKKGSGKTNLRHVEPSSKSEKISTLPPKQSNLSSGQSPLLRNDLKENPRLETTKILPNEEDEPQEDLDGAAWSVCDADVDHDEIFDFSEDAEELDNNSTEQDGTPVAEFDNPERLHDEIPNQEASSLSSYGMFSGPKATDLNSPSVAETVTSKNNERNPTDFTKVSSSFHDGPFSGLKADAIIRPGIRAEGNSIPADSKQGYGSFHGQKANVGRSVLGAEVDENLGLSPTNGVRIPTQPATNFGTFSGQSLNNPFVRSGIVAPESNRNNARSPSNPIAHTPPVSGSGNLTSQMTRNPTGNYPQGNWNIGGSPTNITKPPVIPAPPAPSYGLFSGQKSNANVARAGVGNVSNSESSANFPKAPTIPTPSTSSSGLFSGQKSDNNLTRLGVAAEGNVNIGERNPANITRATTAISSSPPESNFGIFGAQRTNLKTMGVAPEGNRNSGGIPADSAKTPRNIGVSPTDSAKTPSFGNFSGYNSLPSRPGLGTNWNNDGSPTYSAKTPSYGSFGGDSTPLSRPPGLGNHNRDIGGSSTDSPKTPSYGNFSGNDTPLSRPGLGNNRINGGNPTDSRKTPSYGDFNGSNTPLNIPGLGNNNRNIGGNPTDSAKTHSYGNFRGNSNPISRPGLGNYMNNGGSPTNFGRGVPTIPTPPGVFSGQKTNNPMATEGNEHKVGSPTNFTKAPNVAAPPVSSYGIFSGQDATQRNSSRGDSGKR